MPVDVQHGLDLEHTGEIDLGAALTKLAPSFNYTRLSVGDGSLLNAATLRGLAPDQTLVLINGKRRHNMAWIRVLDGVIGYGSGGTDLRAIPYARRWPASRCCATALRRNTVRMPSLASSTWR